MNAHLAALAVACFAFGTVAGMVQLHRGRSATAVFLWVVLGTLLLFVVAELLLQR